MDQDVSLSATLPLSCCYLPTHRAMMSTESHSQKKQTHAAVLQTKKFISLKLFIYKLVWTDNANKLQSVFLFPPVHITTNCCSHSGENNKPSSLGEIVVMRLGQEAVVMGSCRVHDSDSRTGPAARSRPQSQPCPPWTGGCLFYLGFCFLPRSGQLSIFLYFSPP